MKSRTPRVGSQRRHAWASWLRWVAILTLASVLVGCGGGGRRGEREGGPPGAGPGGIPRISDRCAGSRWIQPYQPVSDADWQPVGLTEPVRCFELEPVDASPLGISTTTALVLRSTEELTPEALEQLLQFEPKVPFRVESPTPGRRSGLPIAWAAEEREYRVVPEEPLAEGQLYKVLLLDQPGGLPVQQWSFETARPLRIVHTLPGNEATNVPVDTGIELVFSHEGVQGVEERFHIEPAVSGKFEVHKRTVVFVPEKLEAGTIYRVTVDPGVQVADGAAKMTEGYSFAFETERLAATTVEPAAALEWSRSLWDQPTTEAPVLAVNSFGAEPGTLTGETVKVTVFRFPTLEAFATSLSEYLAIPDWSQFARDEHRPPTTGLEPVTNFEVRLEPLGEYGQFMVRFPEALPAGSYLVRLEAGESERYSWLQVSDVAVYVAVSEPKLLVWANDVATGRPLAAATVSRWGGERLGATGADGILVVATPQDFVARQPTSWGWFEKSVTADLMVEHQGRRLYVPLTGHGDQPYGGFGPWSAVGDERHRYWRYVYVDRPLYHPDDTVRFWGIVRPRDGAAPVEKLTVRIWGGDFVGYGYEVLPLAQTTVRPNEAGTFLGELQLVGATPGYYSLEVRAGELTLASTSLEVRDFVKPAYKINVQPAQQAVYMGQPVSVTIQVSFFDGSPVSELDLKLTTSGGETRTVRTDEAGRVEVSLTVPESSASEAAGLGYTWFYISATPATEEESEIMGSASVQAFPAAITVHGQGVVDDSGRATVSGQVQQVDLGRLNRPEAADFDDFLGPTVAGREVTANITEYTYVKVKTGQRYDFVAKRVVDTYRYDTVEKTLDPLRTRSDDKGRYQLSFATRPDAWYEVKVSVVDDAGREAPRQVYLGRRYAPYDSDRLMMRLDHDKPYRLGDRVVARLLTASDEPVPSGRYLFIRARSGILDQVVLDRPVYEFEFAAEHVPNVEILGVLFTGRTFAEAEWPVSAVLDTSSRELGIRLQPDRERYAPGDEVNLAVQTIDPEGKPKAARVLLAAVDEAIFRILGAEALTYVNILGSLYSPVPAGLIRTRGSHALPQAMMAGAERGGGGGERADFRDVALFEELVTDASGRGHITFTLPDNLTSWRITAQGVTEDLEAGWSMTSLPVGLPFFVTLTMSDDYLAGEEPMVRLRAYGDALSPGDKVRFKLEAAGLLAQPLEAEGQAFQSVEMALPPLVEGRFELKATATAGDRSDTLVRRFRVVPSRWLRVENRYSVVSAGGRYEAPETAQSRLYLTLSDANRGRYAGFVEQLVWTWGDRLDQRLARYLALQLANRYFGASHPQEDFLLAPYQVSSGGLALFPYADADLDITVRAVVAAPHLFGREALIRYLAEIARDPAETRERVISALLGLAALGQPVVGELNRLAAAASPPLSPWERLDLGTAYAMAGDERAAFEVYRALVSEFGQARGETVRLNVGADEDDVRLATSRAAVLGALLGQSPSLAMFAASQTGGGGEQLVLLEQLAFLQLAVPRLPTETVTFRYQRFGESHRESLPAGGAMTLSLAPDELRQLDLIVEEGALGVSQSALVPVDLTQAVVDPEVSLEREYLVNGQLRAAGPLELTLGDEVTIRLRARLGAKAADGCYQVTDLLPSGLRPVTAFRSPYDVYGREDLVWPYQIQGQRVNFCVYRDGKGTPTYRARVVTKGSFVAEPATIQAQAAPESWNYSAARRVEVR